MSAYPMVATAYNLPFDMQVQQPPLLSARRTVNLSVTMQAPPSDAALSALKHAVMHFEALTEAGALCGDGIPPTEPALQTIEGPIRTGCTLTWTLRGCHTDERATAVLTNLLLAVAEHHTIDHVSLRLTDDNRPCGQLPWNPDLDDPYPPRWPSLPFHLEFYDEVMETVHLLVRFRRELVDGEPETIDNELLSWAAAAMEGAYSVAPVSPEAAGMIPDFPIAFDGDAMEWTIEKCRAHRGALDGLLNTLAAVHERVVPIAEVTIE